MRRRILRGSRAYARQRVGARVQHCNPVCPVDDHLVAVRCDKHVIAERSDHRNPERPGDDRSVGRRRPFGECDSEDESFLESEVEELCRTELTRNDDGRPDRRVCSAPARQRANRASPELANVDCPSREQRVVERRERSRVTFRRGPQRFRGGKCGCESCDLLHERRVLRHESVRREDLCFSLETLRDEPFFRARKLCGRARKRGERSLGSTALGSGNGLGRHERRADPDAWGDDDAVEPAFGHCSAATASSSARKIKAVEVAPGSWCPMLRSPR